MVGEFLRRHWVIVVAVNSQTGSVDGGGGGISGGGNLQFLVTPSMDSKEATAFPVSETSTGSSSSSSYVSNNQNLLKTSVVDSDGKDNCENGIKDSVSDEEDEGGYVSGQEEFEQASEKLVLTGADGEAVGKGAEDRGFDEASGVSMAKVDALPISGVSENNSGVEKRINDDEKDGVLLGKDSVDGSVAIADSDTIESKVAGIDGLEAKGEIQNSNLDEGAKGSGGDFLDSFENKEVENVELNAEKKVEEVEMDRDKAEKNKKTKSLTSEAPAGVKFTSEGDSVVGTIDVDTPGPGVAVVQPTDGDIKMEEVPVDESVELVGAAIEISRGSEESSSVEITSEGDSVVDTIHVDMPRQGVDVVGEVGPEVEKVEVPVDENGEPVGAACETNHGVEEAHGVEFTTEGDSIVDTITVDTLVPGVVVVGETDEEIERVKVPVDENAEPIYESSEFKPIEPDNNAVADEKDEKIDARAVDDVANGVHMGVTTNDLVDGDGAQDVENMLQ